MEEINFIRVENPNSLTAQSFMLLKKWVHRDGKNATSKQLRARVGGILGDGGDIISAVCLQEVTNHMTRLSHLQRML